MKVNNYLTIIVFACLAGGYLMLYTLSNHRHDVKQETEMFHIYEIAFKDFSHLKQNVSQLLVSADLIFASHETYLVEGAIAQSNLLIEQINRPHHSESFFKSN